MYVVLSHVLVVKGVHMCSGNNGIMVSFMRTGDEKLTFKSIIVTYCEKLLLSLCMSLV